MYFGSFINSTPCIVAIPSSQNEGWVINDNFQYNERSIGISLNAERIFAQNGNLYVPDVSFVDGTESINISPSSLWNSSFSISAALFFPNCTFSIASIRMF